MVKLSNNTMIRMNEFDHLIFYRCLSNSYKGLNGDSNPDLCHAGAVLHQLRSQVNRQLVDMWVHHEPLDVEIDDITSILNTDWNE